MTFFFFGVCFFLLLVIFGPVDGFLYHLLVYFLGASTDFCSYFLVKAVYVLPFLHCSCNLSFKLLSLAEYGYLASGTY